jgi:HSP20 family protein
MTIVRRASPLGELVSLRQAMDRLFEDSFVRPRGWLTSALEGYGLPLDVTSGPDAVTVEASLPGFEPEDVEITIENGTLNIHAQSESETKEGEGESLVTEIRRGSVSRTITLPTGLEPDKATATYEHGMLKLRIPKAEAVKPRQIRITPTTDVSTTNGLDGSKSLATGETSAKSPAPAGA